MSRQHATRTCHFCGVQAPQPEMIRDQIYVESGQSKSSITGATIIGAAAGSRSAKRALERTVFGAGNRTYLRKREIWRCDASDCRSQAQAAARNSRKSQGMPVWLGVLIRNRGKPRTSVRGRIAKGRSDGALRLDRAPLPA